MLDYYQSVLAGLGFKKFELEMSCHKRSEVFLVNKKPPRGGFLLLFRFLESNVLAGLWIVLLEFNLTRDKLAVLARPVGNTGAL